MRECNICKGSDDALISRTMGNEKTVLLTHFFRCVRLPQHVLERDHPFYTMFDPRRPAHLFFSKADGDGVNALNGAYTQADIWKAMESTVKAHYDGDVKRVLRDLQKVLAQYDNIDSMEEDVRIRLDREIERRGPKSAKVKKYRAQIAKFKQRREAQVAREKVLIASLKLKKKEAEPKGDAAGGQK